MPGWLRGISRYNRRDPGREAGTAGKEFLLGDPAGLKLVYDEHRLRFG